ncbi:ABC transporter ATP-binding protein, partial [Lawsonibacter sp. DFI.6.74]|nr:ABC transporter ATP-binding protein [Lawsonibacter sp. DFI.6.74]
KVYSLDTDNEDLINEIQNKYKVVSINRGIENISVRFISEVKPNYKNIKLTEAKFEDVYMFYFDLEDAREV